MTKSEYIGDLYTNLCGQQYSRDNRLEPILNYINGRPTYITIREVESNNIIISIKIAIATSKPLRYYIKVTHVFSDRFNFIGINENITND